MREEANFRLEPKKVFLALLSVGLAFLLIIISVLSINNTSAAEEKVGVEAVKVMDLDKAKRATGNSELIVLQDNIKINKGVEYFLPYPGILPDHPLYWLKMVRDRIWLWLTKNPAQKSQRLILYADKRVGAAKALIEGNKKALGVTTLTKAEKYLEKAWKEIGAISDNQSLKEQLGLSGSKHQELLNNLEKQIPESLAKPFDEAKQTNHRMLKELK